MVFLNQQPPVTHLLHPFVDERINLRSLGKQRFQKLDVPIKVFDIQVQFAIVVDGLVGQSIEVRIVGEDFGDGQGGRPLAFSLIASPKLIVDVEFLSAELVSLHRRSHEQLTCWPCK